MNYNLDYFESILTRCSTTAEKIFKIRWEFIKEFNPKTLLDYGCGVGWMRAYRPRDVIVDTFDIGCFPQTGIQHFNYDMICFWDVIEHMPDLSVLKEIFNKTKYVAISIPIRTKDTDMNTWVHHKPEQHYHWFYMEDFKKLIDSLGFEIVKIGQPECPPRTDVYNFVCRRKV